MNNEILTIGRLDNLEMLIARWQYRTPGGPLQNAEMAVLRPREMDPDSENLQYEQNIHPAGDPHRDDTCDCRDYTRHRFTVGEENQIIGAWSWSPGPYALCGLKVIH